MKKTLVGLSNNITINKSKIESWYKSYTNVSKENILLLVANPNQNDIDTINELGIDYRVTNVVETDFINHKRLKNTLDFFLNDDSDIYLVTDVFDDIFLKRYATSLIKRQWGENLKKFSGVQLPGVVTLNGHQIFEEALQEIQQIEEEMQGLRKKAVEESKRKGSMHFYNKSGFGSKL
jgi:hypothetical protein